LPKNPEDLSERQAAKLKDIKRKGGATWRAFEMKESFRAIFAGDLDWAQADEALERWCARAQRSRLAPSSTSPDAPAL
jgi:transposase